MSFSELGAILNLAIVLIFGFLIMTLAASLMVEVIAALARQRGKYLKRRMGEMFDDVKEVGFAGAVIQSPVIRSFMMGGRFPSYVDPAAFSQAVVGVIREHGITDTKDLPPVLRVLAEASNLGLDDDQIQAFRTEVETWFNQTMDRLTGSYKRWARAWLFACGLLLAVIFNINMIEITRSLWDARHSLGPAANSIAEVVEQIDAAQTDGASIEEAVRDNPDIQNAISAALAEIPGDHGLDLPIGWVLEVQDCVPPEEEPEEAGQSGTTAANSGDDEAAGQAPEADEQNLTLPTCKPLFDKFKDQMADNSPTLVTILGWVISACLVIPGTQFWFNALGQLLSIRSAGLRPQDARKPTQT